jgi:hypothetical protein
LKASLTRKEGRKVEISIWYSVDNRPLFVMTTFEINDKKSISKAQKELNDFVKKYRAFNDSDETGILLMADYQLHTRKYHRINQLGTRTITAHIRNYIHDFNKETEGKNAKS